MHFTLIEILKERYKEKDCPLAETLTELTMDQICRLFFLNYRYNSGNPKGLRLSGEGLQHFKTNFQHWEIELEEKYVTGAMRLFLDRYLTKPYHIEANHLTLFEKQAAMEIKLSGNSVANFMELRGNARPE